MNGECSTCGAPWARLKCAPWCLRRKAGETVFLMDTDQEDRRRMIRTGNAHRQGNEGAQARRGKVA